MWDGDDTEEGGADPFSEGQQGFSATLSLKMRDAVADREHRERTPNEMRCGSEVFAPTLYLSKKSRPVVNL